MKRIFLGIAIAGLFAGTSAGAHPCWIGNIFVHGDAISIQLVSPPNPRIEVMGADHNFRFYKPDSATYQEVDYNYTPIGDPVTAIPLSIGDNFSLATSPENACSIKAAFKDHQIGVVVSTYFFSNAPWDNEVHTSEHFLPANQEAP